MNSPMDELLRQWAEWRDQSDYGGGTGHPIALAMDTRGEIIPSTRLKGACAPNDRFCEIELFYVQQLDGWHSELVRLHYLVPDEVDLERRLLMLRVSRRTYFYRLNSLHASLQQWLYLRRRAA